MKLSCCSSLYIVALVAFSFEYNPVSCFEVPKVTPTTSSNNNAKTNYKITNKKLRASKHHPFETIISNLRMSAASPEENMSRRNPFRGSSSSSSDVHELNGKVDDLVNQVKNISIPKNAEELLQKMKSRTTSTENDFASSASTALTAITDATKNFDVRKSFDLATLRNNIVGDEGEFGTRGEGYFLIQLTLMGCVLLGDVPLLGSLLFGIAGPALLLSGLAVLGLGLKDLEAINLSPWPTPPKDGSLITDGIFRHIRHPIYSGLLLTFTGYSLLSHDITRLLLTGILFYTIQIKTDIEEQNLLDKFGYEYQKYSQQVQGKFVPNQWLQQLPWNQKNHVNQEEEY